MKKIKSLLKVILPLAVGFFFVYLSYNSTSEEDRILIYSYIQKADLRFVMLSVFFGILSHLSRAYRWKYLLSPLGYQPRFINSVLAVLIAYIANLGIPRSGEILRATTLSSYEKIPFEKTFGTIVAERLVDLLILMGFVLTALVLQFDIIWSILSEKKISTVQIVIGLAFVIIGYIILKKLFTLSQNPLIIRIKNFFWGLAEGIMSLKNMPNKGRFIGHTLFIWLMYLAMFYVVKWTVPETASLGMNAILPAFVVGGLAISATNGGIGIYPFSVALVLAAFKISNESGLAFGWIMWTSQTLMIIVFGSLSFFVLPLVNRQQKD
ncbi:MAG: flippase-like domain-containing protein [Flavobacteriaceae bacterium]|nr:flippase-like domain-containing protein [Flavobacteriaceae bacterium]